ncbi:FAD-binding protein [Pontibacter sp. G13]|uniref:FAD-binding protein n=1 Tax=Pontibacter sp. G13 TaxID=3074898 RepID=UPI002889A937|nr:FAD-binding protein [Pontibacter sp. G13]WNJ18315.1 FAD-binding protein [Pontibacter sp. G13]
MQIQVERLARSNWSRTEHYIGWQQLEPTRAEEIAEIVKYALQHGKKVHCKGKEHHWGPCGESDEDTLIIKPNMTHISEIEVLEPGKLAQIEVGASVQLETLNLHLGKTAWALENMGAIAEQHISALVSTNTHGTHPKKGGFATLVQAFEYVNSRGEIRYCKRGTPSWEEAKYVLGSVGKFGIITRLTMRLVPAFNLEVHEELRPNSEVLLQASIDEMVEWASKEDGYVRWFLLPCSGTGYQRKKDTGSPDDTVETGYSQVTTWVRTPEQGKGRGWFRTQIEGFVANVLTKKIDRLMDRDFRDREPDRLHKVVHRMVKFMKFPHSFVGRSDLTLTAEPNMPIKSQVGSHTSELYFRVECAEVVIKAVLKKIDHLASIGKCFIWKPMRVRLMAGDQDALCSQVYEPQSGTPNVYMTMDIDVYEGQYIGRLEETLADIRAIADEAIAAFNQSHETEYPLTTFHLGKVPPLVSSEYKTLFCTRPGIQAFKEELTESGSLVFMHGRFLRMFGLEEASESSTMQREAESQ